MSSFSFRSDKSIEKELQYIRSVLGLNQSQAIIESIHAFYEELKVRSCEKRSIIDEFTKLHLLDASEEKTDSNLSINYKEELSEWLDGKTR